MHIENTTKGRDLSPATDELWKKFYVRQFGIESANLVVERMGQKRVIFKWKQLYEAKLKDREEATQKSLDRIKKRYQEEDASLGHLLVDFVLSVTNLFLPTRVQYVVSYHISCSSD
ncbi:uncharacterized protein [Primulina huaijiensis]|uniref:uncharacterized protein isoform X5 n=1 Tax=Primulina huaijiensis TaxID=1492673 RepID=UPI003CC71502